MERSSWDCDGFNRDVIEFDVDKDIIFKWTAVICQ